MLAEAKTRSAISLAKDMEQLYDQFTLKDEQKQTAALKLADLYFEASVESEKSTATADLAQVDNIKKVSLKYYELALNGHNGAFKKLEGVDRVKVLFQMARLKFDVGAVEVAKTLWTELVAQNLHPRIQRESALRLAELKELNNSREDLLAAKKLYQIAIKTADTNELKSYINYRAAWVDYRANFNEDSVNRILESMTYAKPQARPDLMKDLVLFLSHAPAPASKSLDTLVEAEKKYEIKGNIPKLADSYRSIDRQEDFKLVSEYMLKDTSQADVLIFLLEDEYATRNLSGVKKQAKKLQNLADEKNIVFSSDEKKKESINVLYQMLVQMDGLRKNEDAYQPLFLQISESFIKIFDDKNLSPKVLNGWVVANTNENEQTQFLQKISKNVDEKSDLQKLISEKLLALAIKSKNYVMIKEESAKLLKYPDNKNSRKLKYIFAKAAYDNKETDLALAEFANLYNPETLTSVDEEALFGLNLTIDTLTERKNYDGIASLIGGWTSNKKVQSLCKANEKCLKTVNELNEMKTKATFESAVAKKNDDSLDLFVKNCMSKVLEEQSCKNAKGLALEKKNLPIYFKLLAHEGNTKLLASEYEYYGYFSEAAHIYETQLDKNDIKSYLKIALLYEISNDLKKRDEWLTKATSFFSQHKITDAEQGVLYSSLNDANLVNAKTLDLPWNAAVKQKVTVKLAESGSGNAKTKAILLASCDNLGSAWLNEQTNSLKEQYQVQQKIKLTGSQSQKNFKKRLDLIKKMDEKYLCLKGLPADINNQLTHSVGQTYNEFAQDILSTEIPAGLDAETVEQVKLQIEAMAKPFQNRADELGKSVDANYVWNGKPFQVEAAKTSSDTVATSTGASLNWLSEIEKLKTGEVNDQVISTIQKDLEASGKTRIAAYFKGRQKL